jgi:predicted lysophospholipase L1 biosynthesis ABC-type transport system permease subunit
MGAIGYVAARELRRSWRTVLALTVLVAIGAAVVLTLTAGARRADSAYQRFRAETFAADVSVAPSELDANGFDAIERLPQVAAATRPVFPFVVPAESGLYPYLDFLAYAQPEERGAPVDVPRVLEGRLPRADRADEIAVIERFADEANLAIGDRVRFDSYGPDQFEQLFTSGDVGAPSGPRTSATVTGIIDAPDFISEREANFLPRVFLTPAFLDRYGDAIAIYPGGITARLHNGARDVPAFTRAVRELLPDDPGLEIQPTTDVSRRIDESIRVLVVALALCAASAALAALAAIGFAMSRHLSRSPGDVVTMRWLGMTARERIGASVMTMLPVAVGGAALGVALAYVASPLMPVGIARDADPDLGLSFDPLVLGVGFVIVAVAVSGLAALAAWRAGRFAASTEGIEAPSRPPRRFRRATPVTAPVARPLGVRMALEPGRGTTAVPVRSAAIGAVLGVIGVVGTVVFAASLSATLDRPARYGFPWDAVVAGFEGNRADELVDALDDDQRVRALGVLDTGVAIVGRRDVNAYAFHTRRGQSGPTILEGRAIHDDGEIVLGAGTASELDVGVGDTVTVRGQGQRHRLHVVGLAALPVLDDRSGVDIGAIMSPRRLQSVAPSDSLNHDVLVRWVPGVDAATANRQLARTSESEVFSARLPSELSNLQRVRALPWTLAAFLGTVALIALAHAVASTVRRRRRDLAVLRTLGLVDRQLSALVRWQAATFAVIGLVVGVPVGLVAGRFVWHEVAGGIGVDAAGAIPTLPLLLLAVAVVVVALAVAAVPAHYAKHVHAAAALAVHG